MKQILTYILLVVFEIFAPILLFGVGYISGYLLRLFFGYFIDLAFIEVGIAGISPLIPTIMGAIFVIQYKLVQFQKRKEE